MRHSVLLKHMRWWDWHYSDLEQQHDTEKRTKVLFAQAKLSAIHSYYAVLLGQHPKGCSGAFLARSWKSLLDLFDIECLCCQASSALLEMCCMNWRSLSDKTCMFCQYLLIKICWACLLCASGRSTRGPERVWQIQHDPKQPQVTQLLVCIIFIFFILWET